MVKNLLAMEETQETWVRSLGPEDPPEEKMAPHSSVLAWRTPWAEEPGGPKSMFPLCPTPCHPMDCGLPGPSCHGILQPGILKWIAIFSSRGSFQPRKVDYLPLEPRGKPHLHIRPYADVAASVSCYYNFRVWKWGNANAHLGVLFQNSAGYSRFCNFSFTFSNWTVKL